MVFHRVDSSYYHNLYLNLEKTRLIGCHYKPSLFFYSKYLFKMYSLRYFTPPPLPLTRALLVTQIIQSPKVTLNKKSRFD